MEKLHGPLADWRQSWALSLNYRGLKQPEWLQQARGCGTHWGLASMSDGFRAPETLEGAHSAVLESDGMHPCGRQQSQTESC